MLRQAPDIQSLLGTPIVIKSNWLNRNRGSLSLKGHLAPPPKKKNLLGGNPLNWGQCESMLKAVHMAYTHPVCTLVQPLLVLDAFADSTVLLDGLSRVHQVLLHSVIFIQVGL